jgi:hypothetical protein
MHPRTVALLTVCVLAGSWSASAHHSHGNYDMQKYTNLKGTIKEVHWMNPHSWVYPRSAGRQRRRADHVGARGRERHPVAASRVG